MNTRCSALSTVKTAALPYYVTQALSSPHDPLRQVHSAKKAENNTFGMKRGLNPMNSSTVLNKLKRTPLTMLETRMGGIPCIQNVVNQLSQQILGM